MFNTVFSLNQIAWRPDGNPQRSLVLSSYWRGYIFLSCDMGIMKKYQHALTALSFKSIENILKLYSQSPNN